MSLVICVICMYMYLCVWFFIEVKCGLPTFQQQKNLLLIEPNKTLHDFNSTVHFTCKDGFNLNGPQSVSCQQNGSFGLVGNMPSCSGKYYFFVINLFGKHSMIVLKYLFVIL